jgi:murein DD-endopeptidase MepM/ murein hydrolase activator NlpD
MEEKKQKKWVARLKNRYRLVIMNEDTFEEKTSLKLRPLNVFVTAGVAVIVLITLTTLLIAFTPLREYIPGYADVKSRRQMIGLLQKADSLQLALNARDLYLSNLRSIINGQLPGDPKEVQPDASQRYDTIRSLNRSVSDSLLRQEIESQDPFSLNISNDASMDNSIRGFLFFPPLKGTVTARFDPVKKHFGVDIVGPANEPIKASLDGTVILSNFTSETGWVIGIQQPVFFLQTQFSSIEKDR